MKKYEIIVPNISQYKMFIEIIKFKENTKIQ